MKGGGTYRGRFHSCDYLARPCPCGIYADGIHIAIPRVCAVVLTECDLVQNSAGSMDEFLRSVVGRLVAQCNTVRVVYGKVGVVRYLNWQIDGSVQDAQVVDFEWDRFVRGD